MHYDLLSNLQIRNCFLLQSFRQMFVNCNSRFSHFGSDLDNLQNVFWMVRIYSYEDQDILNYSQTLSIPRLFRYKILLIFWDLFEQ